MSPGLELEPEISPDFPATLGRNVDGFRVGLPNGDGGVDLMTDGFCSRWFHIGGARGIQQIGRYKVPPLSCDCHLVAVGSRAVWIVGRSELPPAAAIHQ